MVMGCCFLSVVIDIINVRRAVIKTKNNAPVGAYGNRPKPFHLAFERMQPQPRLVQVSKGRSGMKGCQNIPQRLGVFRIYPPWIVLFKEALQALVAYCADHLAT